MQHQQNVHLAQHYSSFVLSSLSCKANPPGQSQDVDQRYRSAFDKK